MHVPQLVSKYLLETVNNITECKDMRIQLDQIKRSKLPQIECVEIKRKY